MKSKRVLTLFFGVTILLSAFLVFQVQPIISKAILPWFGGSPAVWTTCMLFFQVLLFTGYCYAHGLSKLRPTLQAAVHLPLMMIAVVLMPIIPAAEWKPIGSQEPVLHILWLLLAHVGLPYFLLSSTGPLVQSWFSRTDRSGSAYRLYALSNIGSLAALLSYPILFEPAFDTVFQGRLWSIGFGVFVVACGLCLLALVRMASPSPLGDHTQTADDKSGDEHHPWLVWLALPALASVLLLATTNHVCQDVAVIPFLWIAPLSLYLLTFIICFDRESWYSGRTYSSIALCLVVAASCLTIFRILPWIFVEAGLYLAIMFTGCMICHGELVRRKPAPRHLTKFYLTISGGGALGGMFVAVFCPLVFNTHAEMPISLLALFLVAIYALLPHPRRPTETSEQATTATLSSRHWLTAVALLVAFTIVLRAQATAICDQGTLATRSFYGVLTLTEEATDDLYCQGRYMMHGRIAHGFQFFHPERAQQPTMYYAPDSGVGIAIRNLPQRQARRIGVIGLGVGTLAAYGKAGDFFRFYEINPDVEQIARSHFSFLAHCQAESEVVLGDARLSLERESPCDYDLLVVDAFSGDALPAHLLTTEAIALYKRHLAVDGVLAFNISNRHLDVERVLTPLAELHGLECRSILVPQDIEAYQSPSHWFLMTTSKQFLESEEIVRAATSRVERYVSLPVWTDQYNNLLHILK